MMTREEIIEKMIDELIIEKCASKFKSYLTEEFYRDYILEMYLLILEMKEDKMIKLFEKNLLNYYIIAACRNNILNLKSQFWKKHKARYDLIYLEDHKILFDTYEDR